MKKRLIDANALKEEAVTVDLPFPPYSHRSAEKIVFCYDIDDAPTIDAVEVVRCESCKRWRPDGSWGLDLEGNKRLYGSCEVTHMYVTENHFCGYGAKIEG